VTLDDLQRIMPPPAHRYNAGTPDQWPSVETQLGFPLPQDYKDFINHYGMGQIADFMIIFSPWCPNSVLNLIASGDEFLTAFRLARERNLCPYPLFPEPDGLFPWGIDDQGHRLFWHQVGHPDKWPIVVGLPDGPFFWPYQQTLTEMLVAWLSYDQFYRPFPIWYLNEEQYPEEGDDEYIELPPHRPDRPRTPEEAAALFQPFNRAPGDIKQSTLGEGN